MDEDFTWTERCPGQARAGKCRKDGIKAVPDIKRRKVTVGSIIHARLCKQVAVDRMPELVVKCALIEKGGRFTPHSSICLRPHQFPCPLATKLPSNGI